MRGSKIIAPHSTGLVQKLEGKARNRTRAFTSLNYLSKALPKLDILKPNLAKFSIGKLS